MRKLTWIIPVIFLSGCAAFGEPDASNLSAYCTSENGYRLGYQSKAYFGICPKETEGAFLAGLQRGRAYRANPPQALPYYQRMEETEKQLLATASDTDRARLRESLRDIEWWTIHIVTCSCTYAPGGGGRN
jgi:uncharacterized protein DUF2799